MADPIILPFTFEGKWRDGPLQVQWSKIPVVFAVKHEPTKCIYFGSSQDAATAFYSWYQRLRGLNLQPRLSPSFRAIYTKRDDFVFVILKQWDRGTFQDNVVNEANTFIDVMRARRRDRLLNMDGTTTDQEYWRSRTPPENQPPPALVA